jgi:flagellar capping protein FliD
MGGELSSLGIGSGVLTYDIIDQLREAEEAKLISPTEKKVEETTEKQEALEEFMEMLSEFEDLQDDLSDEITWLKRTTEVTGDEAEVDVTGGVNPQTINLHIDQLAKQDILESKRFNDKDTVVVTESVKLNVFIDEKSYKIDLEAGMKLSELSAKFSSATDGAIVGSALNVGGEDPYRLILKSGEAGENNRILLGNTKMGAAEDLVNLASGDLSREFYINGVDIFNGKTKDDLGSLDKVVEAINAHSDRTKVTAYESKDGTKLILNNANGDIIDFTGSDTLSGGVLDKLGLDGSDLNQKEVETTGIAVDLTDTTTHTMTTGSLEINGVDIFSATDTFSYDGYDSLGNYVSSVSGSTGISFDYDNGGIGALKTVVSAINSKTADWYDGSGNLQQGTGVSVQINTDNTLTFSSNKNMAIDFEGTELAAFGLDSTTYDKTNITTTSSSEAISSSDFPLDIGQYDLYINNKQVITADTTFNYANLGDGSANDLIKVINDKSSLTGVTASYDSGTGKISFENATGGSITFNQSSEDLLETLKLTDQGVGGSDSETNFIEMLAYDHTSIYDEGHIGQSSAYKTNSTSRVQTPQDAIFYFNGVKIERHTNEVDDLIVGADIKLLKVHEGDDDITKVEVKRDDEDIKEKFKEAMEKYQEVNDKIMELIEYDYETKKIGPMQGVQEITSIKSVMTNHLLTYDVTLKFQSMISLGLEIEKDGNIKIDFEKFNEKLEDEPEEIEKLFRGYDTVILGEDTFIDGIWTKINASLDDIISDDDSSLQELKKKWEKEQVAYDEEITEAREEIEAKYARMATKFGAYDGMIADMKNSFAPFEQMVAASYA